MEAHLVDPVPEPVEGRRLGLEAVGEQAVLASLLGACLGAERHQVVHHLAGRVPLDLFDEGAVAHAFSVASGLDSVVVGESQILGQVRAALALAQEQGTVGTVLNALLGHAAGAWKPHLLQRLDKGTSGLVIVAKSREALAALQRSRVEKDYLALVWGRPTPPAGRDRPCVP